MNNTGQKYSTKKLHRTLTLGLTILLMVSLGFVVIPKALGAPDTCTWTGNGDGTSFVDNNNWAGCDAAGIPEQGDSIIVPPQPTQITIDNDSNYGANLLLDDVTLNGNVILDGKYWDMSGTVTINGTNNILRADNGFRTTTELTSSTGGEVEFEDSIFIATDLPISGALIVTISPDADIDATNGGAVTIGEDAIVVIESTSADYFNTTSWIVNGTLECARTSCLQATDSVSINDGGLFAFIGTGSSTAASVSTNGNALMHGRSGVSLQHLGPIDIQSGTLTVRGNELVPVDYSDANSFTLSGVISGPGDLLVTDSVILSGSNTYEGTTTINNGYIIPRDPDAFGSIAPGAETIIEENGAIVFDAAADSIYTEEFNISATTQNPGRSALINLSTTGRPELKRETTIGGNRVLEGGIKFNDDLIINNGTLTLNVPNGSITQVDTDINGNGTLTKTGEGEFRLYGDSTLTGDFDVQAGVVTLYSPGPSKMLNNKIVLGNNTKLNVEPDFGFVFDNNGLFGFEEIVLSGEAIGISLANQIAAGVNQLSGNGELTKAGAGSLSFVNSADATYQGNIIVEEGELLLNRVADIQDITGGVVTVKETGSIITNNSNVIHDATDITLADMGVFSFNTASSPTRVIETVDALDGVTGTLKLYNAQVTLGGDNGDGDFSGAIDLLEDSILIKSGTGTQRLERSPSVILNPVSLQTGGDSDNLNVANYTNGIIYIDEGILVLDGDFMGTGIELRGGSLKGGGTIEDLYANSGTINPGQSPGILNIAGDATFDSPTSLEFELDGPGQGTEYDLIDVAGNVILNNPTLTIAPGYDPQPNQEFVVIQSSGSITGTFDGVANNSTVLVPYNGSDHNYQVVYSPNNVILRYVGNSQFAQTGDRIQYTAVLALAATGLFGVGLAMLKKPDHV